MGKRRRLAEQCTSELATYSGHGCIIYHRESLEEQDLIQHRWEGMVFHMMTSVRLPEVIYVCNKANPQPEGLWEPVLDCCELWVTWLLLVDMNSRLELLGAPRFSITGVA